MRQPLFTIGVPTYNRHQMLREALDSVLAQGFTDFEVIVGNDYTAERLTAEQLGICDPRIRIVNHPSNLREVGNMNALLELATGRYFTWLFDDDFLEPGFLQAAHDCLVQTSFPRAVFPSFRMLKVQESFQPRQISAGAPVILTGPEFLRRFSPTRPEVASTCGLFDTATLRTALGGVEALCSSPIGIYCEYLLLVKCGLLDRIVYLDAPFYVYRRHAESWSESNLELETHLAAGRELIRRSAEVLRHPALAHDLGADLVKVCQIHIVTFAYKAARIEFARSGFGVGSLRRALARHRSEYGEIRSLFTEQAGGLDAAAAVAFTATFLRCQYLIVRLMIHFHGMSRRTGEARS